MSSHKEHVKLSLESLSIKNSLFFNENKENIIQLIDELHFWLDGFMGKSGRDGRGKVYDYTGIDVIKHREKRHHFQGIKEAVRIFSEKYGIQYAEIIEQEAFAHIVDDFKAVPWINALFSQEVYEEIGFWKIVRGW